jgi:hypothetical protein
MTQAIVVLAVVLSGVLAIARGGWKRGPLFTSSSATLLVCLGGPVLKYFDRGVIPWYGYSAFLALPVAAAIALLIGLCGKQRPTLLHLGLALGLAAFVAPFAIAFSMTFGGGL